VFVSGCTGGRGSRLQREEDLGTSVLDAIESLVARAWSAERAAPRRDAVHDASTIRDYALERLASSADETLTRQAHAAYCLVLPRKAPRCLPEQAVGWLERCD
jgi:hypothetical protein